MIINPLYLVNEACYNSVHSQSAIVIDIVLEAWADGSLHFIVKNVIGKAGQGKFMPLPLLQKRSCSTLSALPQFTESSHCCNFFIQNFIATCFVLHLARIQYSSYIHTGVRKKWISITIHIKTQYSPIYIQSH
jgi:hypothetical protein